ncbi:hypothetical protein QKC54_gp0539 [Megavirus baoshan]|uniref:Uncharacterized protein n=1 Tax=Megavirus baoshan TaxID=2496520 RepID=A0A8K1W7G6_9VIRU|nr:hypothetical protein QKC54_gp0539 [Megavirus baoshan]UFX99820.1 hypothetical protein Mb0533 [Megavirus baoshan]
MFIEQRKFHVLMKKIEIIIYLLTTGISSQ